MDKETFIAKALKDHFDDGSIEFNSKKDLFVQRLICIYEKEKSRLDEEDMDSILFENGIV